MTPSAWIEANGLKPGWAREGVAFSRWWEESDGNVDRREELLQLGRRWFESGTSPGLESLLRANEPFRREIGSVVLRDVVGEDPALGRWRGEDGYIYSWNGISWEKEGIASIELRGIETLPHATAACAVRGCAQTRCRDALQRMRSLARTPGRHVKRVWA
jgi:hypothetical protein